jgi:hypothetical protein
MRLTLFIVAALLTVTWILGAFVFKAGTLIHIFVISAALSFMQGIIFTPNKRRGDWITGYHRDAF